MATNKNQSRIKQYCILEVHSYIHIAFIPLGKALTSKTGLNNYCNLASGNMNGTYKNYKDK